ncbi:MAG TPA: tetratricopeptide repeat protein, partial [Thermoanaerobaculia bacterium]
QARALLNTNQAEKASELLEKAVATKPNDSARHLLLGEVYGQMAQQASMFKAASLAGKVRDEFAKAVELDPNSVDARLSLMQYYLQAPSIMGGDKDKAKQQAAEIKKRDSLAGHRAFAAIAASDKDMNTARAEYIAAVRENPTSPKTHYWYAIYLMTGDKNYKGAGDEFDAALKLDPSYMPAVFQIGHLAAISGQNLARGEESLHKYLAYKPAADDPGQHRTHFWLGMIYEKQGKKAEAKAQYDASLKLRPGQKDVTEALKRVS